MDGPAHIRGDWCPTEGLATGGGPWNTECRLCGATIEHEVERRSSMGPVAPTPTPHSTGAFSRVVSHGNIVWHTHQRKAADRLRWPFTITVGLLVIHAGLSAIDIWAIFNIEQVWDMAWDTLVMVEGIYVLNLLATAVAFIVWSFLAHSNLDTFGRADQTHSHRAAIWWWIAPLANLIMPYRVTAETSKGSLTPQDDTGWYLSKAHWSVKAWWALFLIGTFGNQVESALIERMTGPDLGAVPWVFLFTESTWIAAAVVTIVMMYTINEGQQRLAATWVDRADYAFGSRGEGSREASTFLGLIDGASLEGFWQEQRESELAGRHADLDEADRAPTEEISAEEYRSRLDGIAGRAADPPD